MIIIESGGNIFKDLAINIKLRRDNDNEHKIIIEYTVKYKFIHRIVKEK